MNSTSVSIFAPFEKGRRRTQRGAGILAGLLFLFLLMLTSPVHAETIAPDKLVQDTSDQVIQNLRKQDNIANNLNAAYQIINKYVTPHVDEVGMARSVLGRDRWMAATPAQQQRFTQAFKVLVMRTYAAALSQYTNERVRVLPFHASDADDRVLVQTQILGDGPSLSVNYRLVRLNNVWKMYDFDVEGVSMLRSFRGQFNETLANNNNSLDVLITDIEQHNRGKS